jgi:hypothetical protein
MLAKTIHWPYISPSLTKLPVMKLKIIAAILGLAGFAFVIEEEFKVPKVWSAKNLEGLMLPLADPSIDITHLPDSLYEGLEERVMYKTYPFYLPGTEPEGYYDWLKQQEPQIIFDATKLKTADDWIKAGELVYDYPEDAGPFPFDDSTAMQFIRQSMLNEGTSLTKEKIVPFSSLVIREKGKIEIGGFSCGMCHTRVMPDGKIFKGGQGNNTFDKNFGNSVAGVLLDPSIPDSIRNGSKNSLKALFGAYWIKNGLQQKFEDLGYEEVVKSLTNTFGGVLHRHGTVLGAPTSVPDLYNIKDRKYFDHTGLMRHRNMTDLMLYATLNQQADRYDKYGGKVVMANWPNEGGPRLSRYSDAQLYALGQYLYSLKAPENPEKFLPTILKQGERLFNEQGCVTCHTPPLFTNNMLTPVDGFKVPESHLEKYDIFEVSVETDPALALESRRGTGYYKVPSLIGVWNRTALMHSGNVASLEELFDPARLSDDYIPKGYKPGWKATHAVKGHPFGLELNAADKTALIAYLKSL